MTRQQKKDEYNPMISEKVLKDISMPVGAAEKILSLDKNLYIPEEDKLTDMLCNPVLWNQGLALLKKSIVPSNDYGMQELVVSLRCLEKTREKYKIKGISEEIFIDTMKCFSRFEREYEESYGVIGFDRAYWTVRQLSMLLFRIGTLEYEIELPKKSIQLHICSDSSLCFRDLRMSWEKARDFFASYFHISVKGNAFCESWLLSPFLTPILNSDSRILKFQKEFKILDIDEDADDWMQWVFKIGKGNYADVNLEDLPEKSSLQRAVKRQVLNGRKIGSATGLLNDNPFLIEKGM